MSDRKLSNANQSHNAFAIRLMAAHEAQIDALTAPDLTDQDRLDRFMTAAEFNAWDRDYYQAIFTKDSSKLSPAHLVWREGLLPLSLFANLPRCNCPVVENIRGKYPEIPRRIPMDWRPDRATLDAFARIQQEARIPSMHRTGPKA
jgi:hypothetical protein